MDLSILSQKDKVLNLVVEKLGKNQIDFSEKRNLIKTGKKSENARLAAGVLLPLFFKDDELVFQLIKRASTVPQPGDISCPGGMLNTTLDTFLRPLASHRFSPLLRKDVLEYMKQRGKDTFKNVTLFLTNALRESWEEVGLSPFNILFLGPLPCYDLKAFKRTIFPVTGYVKNKWHFRPNWEVQRVVEIPLKTFFNDENYGIFSVESLIEIRKDIERVRTFPCLIYEDEILWGATFNIIMSFLKIVFDLDLPETHSKRIVKKVLYPDYLTGSQK